MADRAIRLGKAGISAIPVVGGPLVEVLGFLRTPLERRRDAWSERVGAAIHELQEKVSKLSDAVLSQNEELVSTVLKASMIAISTHQEEKLQALRNAVLNVAAGSAPSADQQAMFLDAVEALTVSHMSVLRRLVEQNKRSGQDSIHHRGQAIRPPGVEDAMLAQVLRDLRNRGFVEVDTALDQLDAGTVSDTQVKLTDYGTKFLAFITSPLEKDGASA
jgi:hypothetical protein